MNRRTFLATSGAVAVVGVAGCLNEYSTRSYQGENVPLVPTDDALEWFEDDDAEFVDTRSQREYEARHIEGAVHSQAPAGNGSDDPVNDWPTDQRIVTYCVCPHDLAVARGGTLMSEGYEEVYALDDGLQDWIDRDLPMAGTDYDEPLPSYTVAGEVDPEFSGEEVWIREPEHNQSEVSHVRDDGSYEITFHFEDLEDDTVLVVQTPEGEYEGTFAQFRGEE